MKNNEKIVVNDGLNCAIMPLARNKKGIGAAPIPQKVPAEAKRPVTKSTTGTSSDSDAATANESKNNQS